MNLQIVGLFFDATGILILGVPSLMQMVDQIAAQSGTYWGHNPHMVQALAFARVDTTAGSIFLIVGFMLQVAFAIIPAAPPIVAWVVVCFGIAAALVYYCALRPKWSSWLEVQVAKRLGDGDNTDEPAQ